MRSKIVVMRMRASTIMSSRHPSHQKFKVRKRTRILKKVNVEKLNSKSLLLTLIIKVFSKFKMMIILIALRVRHRVMKLVKV